MYNEEYSDLLILIYKNKILKIIKSLQKDK